ncbi:uncharacterized protein LOC122757197 [Drosophila mojavensis]|uniref:uncharacterized protein LOC122757197 n=1 Tax=Drosophila mojavensis TaxID=7230 RepID=UPI001CD07CA5|nr:uncharacterized protein LOC122757197 [Drosophila mojavensis]
MLEFVVQCLSSKVFSKHSLIKCYKGFLLLFAPFGEISYVADTYEISNSMLLEVWSSNNRQESAVRNYILENLNSEYISEVQLDIIKEKVHNLTSYMKYNLKKCNRNMNRFKQKHSLWLASSAKFKIHRHDNNNNMGGRKSLNYNEAGSRLRRKLASELAEESKNATPLLVHAALISSKKSKETEKTYLLQKAMSNENVWEAENKQSSIAVVPITAEAALAFLMENGLSKQQYINIKTLNKMHGCDIYPPYSELSELKLKCRPKEISYSETKVEVSLQNLLDHTVDRILSMQQEVLEIFGPTHCSLILSYGFDGSTGQSIYKQRYINRDNIDGIDQSLFVTTIIPLKLIDTRNNIISYVLLSDLRIANIYVVNYLFTYF